MSAINTSAKSDTERGATIFTDLAARFQLPKANGAISAHRLISVSSNEAVQSSFNASDVVGVNPRTVTVTDNGAPVQVQYGRTFTIADGAITSGQALKSASGGRVTPLVTSDLSGDTIEDNVGVAFTNQPANDGVELVSGSAADTTQTATIYYTRTGQGNTVYTETKTINGTTQVDFTDTDVALVLAVEKSAATAGTITFREASGNATITTLAAGTLSAGKIAVTAGQTRAYNVAPTAVADAATVKTVGIIGTDENDAVLRASIPLTGTTPVTFPDTFKTVTFLMVGDLEVARTVTVKIGATDSTALYVGKAFSAATAQGDRIQAFIMPSAPALTAVTSTVRSGQEYKVGGNPKVGATSGWVVNGAANISESTLPASQSASTLVIPVRAPLKVGWTITAFKVEAQVESAGGTVTIDADLRAQTNVAADPTDASIGAITQVSVTADTKVEATKSGLSEVVAADKAYYILITATTAGSTDIRLLDPTITVTET